MYRNLSENSIMLALPPTPTRLAFPAKPGMLALPRPKRIGPQLYVYGGLALWVRAEQKNGIWGKLVVTYRAEPSKRSALPYGKVLMEEKYTPSSKEPQTVDKPLSEDIIEATLNHVLPRFFLDLLFKQFPQAKTDSLTFKLVGPFALHRLHQVTPSAESTKEDQTKILDRMLAMWGDCTINEITPELCAPQLLKMDITPMRNCVRLLRRLFEIELGSLVANPRIWHEYHMPARRKGYSPVRAAKKTILCKPGSLDQVSTLVDICEEHLTDLVEGAKYLCAMIILMEAIEVEECCALTAGAITRLEGYEDYFGLYIGRYVDPQGIRSSDEEYTREQRHVLADYENPYEARWLGVSPRLAAAWLRFRDTHPDVADGDLLLHNSRNKNRCMHPEEYREWLDNTLREIFPRRKIILAGEEVSEGWHIEDLLQATAKELASDFGGYAKEELRYQMGQKPQEMDARHYAGFSAPTELAKMALMQERALRAVKGMDMSHWEKGRKRFSLPGAPMKATAAKIRIKIPAGTDAEDIYTKIFAEMGLSATINVVGGLPNA